MAPQLSDLNEKSVVPDVTQDTEARRSAPRGKNQSALPGIGPAMAIAVISGVVCWFWLASGRANPFKTYCIKWQRVDGSRET